MKLRNFGDDISLPEKAREMLSRLVTLLLLPHNNDKQATTKDYAFDSSGSFAS